ncbi:hypothetical protein [Psychrobacter sp. I-STPA6b]|uniref:hypothetical protein n=1 Tax=Psychrobacter sp. I-STPA6b TaxID=2585718 RepID=UPI001D0C5F1C|nr:hypothetical protein [Psychrobacter sp. I-STPA6b]
MLLLIWIFVFCLISIVNAWIVFFDGAKRIEGWLSVFVVGLVAWDWNAEQIKLYVLITWFGVAVLFLYGLFNSDFRAEYLMY